MKTRTLGWTAVAGLILVLSPAALHAQAPAPAAPAAPAQDAPAFKTDKEKTSYAVGMNVGSAIRRDSADLDVNLIVRGLQDALSSATPLLTQDEMRALLTRLQAQLKSRVATQQSEKAARAKSEGDVFLAENKTKEGVVTTASGLQYKILKAGTGAKPAVTDTVVVNYRGTLIDGTEFDNSYKAGKPSTLALNRVIKGWSEALQLMPVGSKWQLYVPSDLAYGTRGAGPRIGPNTALIFDVELLSVQAAGTSPATPSSGTSAATNPAGIDISFKLDPRITKGLYMGDRWVGAPYTQAGDENQVTVEARAQALDRTGKSMNTSPRWVAANTEIATVTPGEAGQVTIRVHRAGETTLRVTSDGLSRELGIKAEKKGPALQVVISPKG